MFASIPTPSVHADSKQIRFDPRIVSSFLEFWLDIRLFHPDAFIINNHFLSLTFSIIPQNSVLFIPFPILTTHITPFESFNLLKFYEEYLVYFLNQNFYFTTL